MLDKHDDSTDEPGDLERRIRSIYDQEIIDMLAGLAKKYRPPHNQDPAAKLRSRTRLQWDEERRAQQAALARGLQSTGGRFRKKP